MPPFPRRNHSGPFVASVCFSFFTFPNPVKDFWSYTFNLVFPLGFEETQGYLFHPFCRRTVIGSVTNKWPITGQLITANTNLGTFRCSTNEVNPLAWLVTVRLKMPSITSKSTTIKTSPEVAITTPVEVICPLATYAVVSAPVWLKLVLVGFFFFLSHTCNKRIPTGMAVSPEWFPT